MTLKKKILTFSPVEKKQEALILQWLDKPHIREFYKEDRLQYIIDELRKFVEKQHYRFDSWISYCDGKPFGYLITSTIIEQKYLIDKWIESGEKPISLDLLIGEEKYLGKGLASPMITDFLLDKFADENIVFIEPEKTNTKAIHVYEKAGFEKLEIFYIGCNPVPHWRMKMKIKNLRDMSLNG